MLFQVGYDSCGSNIYYPIFLFASLASATIETVDTTIFLKYMYYNCILGFPLFRNLGQWKASTATTTPSSAPTTPATTPTNVDDNNEVTISNDIKEDAAFLASLSCSELKPQLDKLFFLYPKLRILQK